MQWVAGLGLFKIRSDFHNINTRSKHEIVIPRFRLANTSKPFLINGVCFYNKMQKSFSELTEGKFKTYFYYLHLQYLQFTHALCRIYFFMFDFDIPRWPKKGGRGGGSIIIPLRVRATGKGVRLLLIKIPFSSFSCFLLKRRYL